MVWAKLDDNWDINPKMLKLSLDAVGLDSRGITWACRNLSDGYLDLSAVQHIAGVRNWKKISDSLVAAGRWVEDAENGGYWIHDFLEFNPSRQEIEEKRASDRSRKSRQKRDPGSGKFHAESKRNPNGIQTESAGIHTVPDPYPTRPGLKIKEVFIESKDSTNPSWQTQGKRDEQENPVEDLANSASRNEPKYVQIPTAEKQDPQDLVGGTIPKAQPLPISDVPTVDIPAPKSLTPIEGKATKARKPDLLFEAIAEVCGINWRDTTRSELGQVRKARSELGNTADGTPDEVRRKAVIYHRMFPNMTLTPMALVKHWSRLEEKNILKTSAELKNEHLERTFASYNIPVMAQEATNGSTNDHGSSDVSSDSSSDAMETAFPSDSTPGTSRRDAIVESQASKHADTSSPRSPAMGRQNAPDTDSGRRLGFEHGFQPNGSQNTSNRSTAPLTGKSEVPPESLPPNGSLSYVNRVEPQVVLTSERPSDLVLDADAERRRIAAKSLISEFAKQKQMADPKSFARRTSMPDGATVVYEDEPLPEYHGSYEDEDMQDYQEESRW